MKQKIHNPNYKVRRLSGGVYAVEVTGCYPFIIIRMVIGSRSYYHLNARTPLFRTLRDAVMHVVFGG